MEPRDQPNDDVVTFLRDEYRYGFLLADPDEICTTEFLEHLVTFTARAGKEPCPRRDAVAADFTRQVESLQRWVRWLLPRRWGGCR